MANPVLAHIQPYTENIGTDELTSQEACNSEIFTLKQSLNNSTAPLCILSDKPITT